jgi:hypothetical protein
MKNAVFLDLAPCTYCINRRFGGMYGLNLSFFFYHEDVGDTFLRNIALYNIYTAPHPKDGILIVTDVKISNLTWQHSFIHSFIQQWLYSPLLDPGRFFSFVALNTAATTPQTRDQPVARPLPTYRTARTQNKRT